MNPSREKDPEALRSDINVTRSRMDDTMDELGERMQPRHLVDEVLGWFRRHNDDPDSNLHQMREKVTRSADAAMHAVVDTVKKNPVPALLIGAGVAWMIYESRREPSAKKTRSEDQRYPLSHEGVRYDPDVHYDRPLQYPGNRDTTDAGWSDQGGSKLGEMKDAVAEKAGAAADQVKEKLSAVGEQTREKLGELKERAGEKLHAARERAGEISARVGQRTREAYDKTRDRVVATADEHPLEVGLVCLAAGVIAGLVLPTPKVVDRVAGPTADRLRDRARESGAEMMEKTREVARAAVTAVKDEARAQGLTTRPEEALNQNDEGNQSGTESRPLESRPEAAGT